MNWLVPRNELTAEQGRAVELHPKEHRLVAGSPGSGKTLILLHRARHLVDEYRIPPERWRIFVFTNALKGYIRTALQDLRLPDDCVLTFDDWCAQFYQRHVGSRLPWSGEGKGPDFEAIRQTVWRELSSRTHATPFYDFAMIDEGQDLDVCAYRILKTVAAHATVFMDHKQQIYENRVEESDVLSALGIRKLNLTLLEAFRSSPCIVRVAASFVSDDAQRREFIRQNPPMEKGERQTPLLYLARDFEDERRHLTETIRAGIDKGDRIAVLFPTNRHAFGYAKGMKEHGLEVEVPPRPGKKSGSAPAHDFSTPLPKFMTYPSAKGLTFETVLMPLLTRARFGFLNGDRLERWLFVGITRATRWVCFSACGESLFLQRFQRLGQQGRLTIRQGSLEPPRPVHKPEAGPKDLRSLF